VCLMAVVDRNHVSDPRASIRPIQTGRAGGAPRPLSATCGVTLGAWSDLDLVKGLAEKSGGAYFEIYRRHSASVSAAVTMVLLSDHRCGDVVAEVFRSLWASPGQFDPTRGTLRSHLRRNAREHGIDLILTEVAGRAA